MTVYSVDDNDVQRRMGFRVVCVCVRTYIYIYMYVCTYVRTYVRMYVCMYVCMS